MTAITLVVLVYLTNAFGSRKTTVLLVWLDLLMETLVVLLRDRLLGMILHRGLCALIGGGTLMLS